MSRELMFAAILSIAATGALADENRGFAFGVGVGETFYDPDSSTGLTGSDHATGWEVFTGYRFNQYAALEATYIDGGKIRRNGIRLHGRAYGGSFVGSLPVGSSFAFFGRAGFMRGETKVRGAGIFTDEDEAPVLGVGIRGMMDVVHVRLEYNRTEFDVLDANRVSLSLAWLF
jgi:OOP family OmpA-OmpF porin